MEEDYIAVNDINLFELEAWLMYYEYMELTFNSRGALRLINTENGLIRKGDLHFINAEGTAELTPKMLKNAKAIPGGGVKTGPNDAGEYCEIEFWSLVRVPFGG